MMNSRSLLNLSLILMLTALATMVYFQQQPNKETAAISPLKNQQINFIQIKYQNQNIEIIKQDKRWLIQQPIQVEADDFRINAILNILSNSIHSQYSINPDQLNKYQLDPANAELVLNQQSILFGGTSAVNSQRYVYTQSQLYLIDDTFYPLITSGYKNLMRRQLFASNTEILDIQLPGQRIYQDSSGSWRSSLAEHSADKLKSFIDNWQHIQAYGVFSATPPYTGELIKINTADGDVTLLLNKNENSTIIINPQLALSYQFDVRVFDSLIKPDAYLIDEDETKE